MILQWGGSPLEFDRFATDERREAVYRAFVDEPELELRIRQSAISDRYLADGDWRGGHFITVGGASAQKALDALREQLEQLHAELTQALAAR